MTDDRTFLIVGASLAGAKAAAALREEGFEGRVVLVGEEDSPPYERPPLSKSFLRGESTAEAADVHPPGFYRDHDIELHSGRRVVRLDTRARTAVTDRDETLPYDRLLLATGASPRRLHVPGAELDGIHYLRTLPDADRLSDAIRSSGRVTVIGAGWIGCEVAASAREMGAQVTMVEAAQVPLERVLGIRLGGFYAEVHREHGVDLRLGSGVDRILGSGRVEEVVLTDGRRIETDLVVAGVGVTPRDELAVDAGIPVANGILTDALMATSVPGVYAAGDVANSWHPLYRRHIRLEHWSAAVGQGAAAARSMLGRSRAYATLPYFFSDQYDVGMEYSGLAGPGDDLILRGDPASRRFVAFWTREGRVTAGMNVNIWDVAGSIADLITSRRPVDPSRLADPNVDLASIAAAEAVRDGAA
ncbi:MAG TPA: FAD-dependent oxidoreductase [Acidimicrobiales bacterium]|nr:FAD-dependent oxidoreductase [Acidimicrobiales bacterium]